MVKKKTFFFQKQAITPKNCEVALENSTENILVRFLQHPVWESSFCLFAKIRGSPNLKMLFTQFLMILTIAGELRYFSYVHARLAHNMCYVINDVVYFG